MNGTFHHSPLSAARLQKLLAFLRSRGEHGATTLEINEHCQTTRASSDISELRANNVRVVTKYEGEVNGRKIHRYILLEEKNTSPRPSPHLAPPTPPNAARDELFAAPTNLAALAA